MCVQLKKLHETAVGEFGQRINLLTSELSSYSAREPEFLLAAKTLQGKLDRAEIEVKRLTRQYEAARKKAEFLETQQQQQMQAQAVAAPFVVPLQSASHSQLQHSPHSTPTMLSASGARSSSIALVSSYQPIPFAQSMLPPTFAKAK